MAGGRRGEKVMRNGLLRHYRTKGEEMGFLEQR